METAKIITDELYQKVKKAALDLEEKGYAVIEDVFTLTECAEIRAKMWEHLSEITQMRELENYCRTSTA